MSKKNNGGMVYSTNKSYMQDLLADALREPTTLEPEQQQLRVRRDAKQRKGKIVTLVTGFEGSKEDLADLCKQLKQACGVGGSAKDGAIIIQGDLVDKVIEQLQGYGYSKTKKG